MISEKSGSTRLLVVTMQMDAISLPCLWAGYQTSCQQVSDGCKTHGTSSILAWQHVTELYSYVILKSLAPMARLNRAHSGNRWTHRWSLWILFGSRWGASKKERPGRPGFWAILLKEKKIAYSMDPFQFGHFIDMSRNRGIQSWHLRLLLLDEWKDTSRSETEAGSSSENACCNWGNEKAQAKEAAKVWARQKNPCAKEHQVPIQQKRIIMKFCDHMMSHDVAFLVLVFTRLLPRLHDAKRSWRQRRLRIKRRLRDKNSRSQSVAENSFKFSMKSEE